MKFTTLEQIAERRSAIKEEMNKPEADLDALEAEVRELAENEKQIIAGAADAAEKRSRIAAGLEGVTVVEKHGAANSGEEIRNSQKYIDAFARYLISNDDRECRALLTVNASSGGSVPVPSFVSDIIHTAWEKDTILSKVKKTAIRGNLEEPFEKSTDPAYIHAEGTTAVTEEDLELGIVELKPVNIKKWIRVSDEVIAMGGQAMIEYIYSELTYQIMKALKAAIIGAITGASASDSSSAIGIPQVTGAPSLTIIPEAESYLGDDVQNVFVILNRRTTAAFNAARVSGNFSIDPYDGLGVLYCDALPVYSSANEAAVYGIVGDLQGAQVNYPEGEGIVTKYDDLTEAAADMVRVHGRQYAGYGVTGKGMFVNLVKPTTPVTT